MKKKQFLVVGVVLVFVLGIIVALNLKNNTKKAADDGVSNVVTVISKEEYQFYREIVEKDYKGKDEKELEQKTKEYAREVYAQFGLGEAYGICKPYSYESLKMDMEAENQQRQAKNDAGEVVYGTLEYTLENYLPYTLSNLKLQIVDYLTKNQQDSLEKEAKAYWEKHQDKFQRIEKITYRLGEKTKTVMWEELPTLEKTDSELFEILYYGEEGEQFTLLDREEAIDGEILERTMHTTDFKEDKSAVLKTYISDVYYGELVKQAEKEHPLEFELNQK